MIVRITFPNNFFEDSLSGCYTISSNKIKFILRSTSFVLYGIASYDSFVGNIFTLFSSLFFVRSFVLSFFLLFIFIVFYFSFSTTLSYLSFPFFFDCCVSIDFFLCFFINLFLLFRFLIHTQFQIIHIRIYLARKNLSVKKI